MHLATLIAISLPFLPSIISHPVVDGAEAPSRVLQGRQYDTLISSATGTGGTFPSSTGTGSLGQKSSLKLMDGGGLLAACASASLGSPSSTSTATPLDTTEDESYLTDSTATASAGLTLPTGSTEKRQVEKRQAWHSHMAKISPQDFAKICSMVEKYSQKPTAGTQKLSTTTTGGDTTDDTTEDTTGETTATVNPTGTASATLATSTTEASELSEKKMKRANGW